MDVYVWGTQDAEPMAETLPALAMRVLREVREFDSINCALGATDFFGIRDGVLVELRYAEPGGLQVRFADGLRAGQAWSVAHAFLWLVTRQPQVAEEPGLWIPLAPPSEVMLQGPMEIGSVTSPCVVRPGRGSRPGGGVRS